MEYKQFVQKMIALNLEDILPSVEELIDSQFCLYYFIHWTEIAVSIEALHSGLITMKTSPKDARIKCANLFHELLPLRIQEAKKDFIQTCKESRKIPKEWTKAFVSLTEERIKKEPKETAFNSLEDLLHFAQEKAAQFSMVHSKENQKADEIPPSSQVLAHLVDDVYVVRHGRALSNILEENNNLRKRVQELELGRSSLKLPIADKRVETLSVKKRSMKNRIEDNASQDNFDSSAHYLTVSLPRSLMFNQPGEQRLSRPTSLTFRPREDIFTPQSTTSTSSINEPLASMQQFPPMQASIFQAAVQNNRIRRHECAGEELEIKRSRLDDKKEHMMARDNQNPI